MKNKSKKYLYVVLPLLLFLVSYLLFSYGNISFDMSTWNPKARALSALVGLIGLIAGGLLAYAIDKEEL